MKKCKKIGPETMSDMERIRKGTNTQKTVKEKLSRRLAMATLIKIDRHPWAHELNMTDTCQVKDEKVNRDKLVKMIIEDETIFSCICVSNHVKGVHHITSIGKHQW